MAAKGGDKEPMNNVAKDMILCETIKKELRHSKLYTEFMINPFTKMYNVTGKPNSIHDAVLDGGVEDELMKAVINQARKPPTHKYTSPQTSSQEYGWISQPLLQTDKNDIRLNHFKKMTDVTKPKEAEWRLLEQTQNLN